MNDWLFVVFWIDPMAYGKRNHRKEAIILKKCDVHYVDNVQITSSQL